jgi:hypothetical protein
MNKNRPGENVEESQKTLQTTSLPRLPSSPHPNSNSKLPNIQSNFVAAGTFGCIIKPALPNRVNNKWIQYPQNVTKLLKNSSDLNKTIKNSKKVYKMTKNKGQIIYPYQFNSYIGQNLKENTRERCVINVNNTLYPVRLPNLGIDVSKLYSTNNYLEFRKVPIQTVLEQIYKCVAQVRIFQENGYIHGDIRETNVMVKPKLGTITIIDFDWFMPKDKFMDKYKYALGFYSNPPESLLFKLLDMIQDATDIEQTIREYIKSNMIYESTIQDYLYYTRLLSYRNNISKFKIDNNKLLYSLIENAKYVKEVLGDTFTYTDYANLMFPFFDNYGLCFTLLQLLYITYPSIFKEKSDRVLQELSTSITNGDIPYTYKEIETVYDTLKKIVDKVLGPSTELWMKRRISIQVASAQMDEIMHEYFNKIETSHESENSNSNYYGGMTRRRMKGSKKHTLKRR